MSWGTCAHAGDDGEIRPRSCLAPASEKAGPKSAVLSARGQDEPVSVLLGTDRAYSLKVGLNGVAPEAYIAHSRDARQFLLALGEGLPRSRCPFRNFRQRCRCVDRRTRFGRAASRRLVALRGACLLALRAAAAEHTDRMLPPITKRARIIAVNLRGLNISIRSSNNSRADFT
jgi:hypothetical protein